MTKEEQFEYALKCASLKAFDALLTCGVRNLDGLLRLTAEEMKNAAVSERICKEILKIQSIIYSNNESDIVGRLHIAEMDVVAEPSPPTYFEENNPTPIPTKLMERLPTRARNVLTRENIYTVERLMELKDEDLFELTGIGRKTVHDIKHLQVKVKLQSNNDQTSKAKDKLELPDKSNVNQFRIRFNSRTSEHWPSDPEDWSLLSRIYELIYVIHRWTAWTGKEAVAERVAPILSSEVFFPVLLEKHLTWGTRHGFDDRVAQRVPHLNPKHLEPIVDINALDPQVRQMLSRQDLTADQRTAGEQYLKSMERINQGKEPDGFLSDD